jgi:hypothetical protein
MEQIIGKKHPRDEDQDQGEEKECEEDREGSSAVVVSCILCLETNESQSKILSSHQCPQCKADSWSICGQCEESLYSKMCPICRGDYAPLRYYAFRHDEISLSGCQSSAQAHAVPRPPLAGAINLAKISLIQYEKVAVWCPHSTPPMIHFSFPQDLSKSPREMEFLHVSLPITDPTELHRLSDQMTNEPNFLFTNSIWDRLDEVLEGTVATETTAPSGTGTEIATEVEASEGTVTLTEGVEREAIAVGIDQSSESIQDHPLPVPAVTVSTEALEQPVAVEEEPVDEGEEEDSHTLGIKETLQRVISLLASEGAVFLTPLNSTESRELIEAYLS